MHDTFSLKLLMNGWLKLEIASYGKPINRGGKRSIGVLMTKARETGGCPDADKTPSLVDGLFVGSDDIEANERQ